MSGPRVLYVLKRFPRLSETFILDELLRLEEAGISVAVDSLRPPEDQPRHPDLQRLRAPVRYLGRGPIEAQAQEVATRAMAGGFDRIHAHFGTAAAETAVAAGRLSGVPTTVTCHAKDIFHVDYAAGLARRLEGAAGLVTVSRYNARHLAAVVPGVPITVIYNGVDPAPVSEPRPGGPVLTVARLVPKKGIDLLVRAAAVLSARGTPIDVEIVGDGPERDSLEELAGELGLAERIRFLGALTKPDVDAAYQRASMFCLPCRIAPDGDRDGMPTVLGEAMRRGLPVVSTDLIGIPELVIDGETGLLAPPEDPSALASALHGLIDDPGLAATLAGQGAGHAARLLDPTVATARLIDAFREKALV